VGLILSEGYIISREPKIMAKSNSVDIIIPSVVHGNRGISVHALNLPSNLGHKI
jgi:hypothetical protein